MSKWWHVLLLGILLAAGAWFSLRDLTFFSSDTGLRYLQVRTFQEYGWRQAAIPYDGLQYDPGMRFVPYYGAYSRYGNELVIVISLFVPLAVAVSRNLFGPVGIVVVPVVGTLITAGGAAALWHLIGQQRARWIFWGTALSTPLLFYSMTLWDHTVGVALSTVAVYMAARTLRSRSRLWPVAAGAFIALAVFQRADIAPMAVALGFALLIVGWPRWRMVVQYAIGGVLGLLAIAPFNLIWVGHPLGMAIARFYLGYLRNSYSPFQYYEGIEITHAMAATRQLLHVEGGQMPTLVAALLLITGNVFLALVLRMPSLRRRTMLYVCLALVVGGTVLSLLPARSEPVNGLLTTLPLFGLALAYIEDRKTGYRVYRLVFLTTWVYVALALLVLRAPGGAQWGGRYVLAAVPLIFFLAMYTVQAYKEEMPPAVSRALSRVAVVLVVLSLLVQFVGLIVLSRFKADQREWQAMVTELHTDVVLTNNALLASYMAGLEHKIFLYVETEDDIALLAQRLAAQGVNRVGVMRTPSLPLGIPERSGNVRLVQERPGVLLLETVSEP
jgi:hypothetical protein